MSASGMPNGLRWFMFVIGVGALIACGGYVGTARGDVATGWGLLRALMFLLMGLFFILMYGENRGGKPSDRNTRQARG